MSRFSIITISSHRSASEAFESASSMNLSIIDDFILLMASISERRLSTFSDAVFALLA